jgi:two-component system, LytTR family, response regulator
MRAIVVDDEPIARRRLKALLQREESIEVVGECEDGATAIDAIRRQQPDVVFLDVQMPGLDGFDVIEALEPAEHLAIVFVTAYDQYAVRAFDVHAVAYIGHFEADRLHRTVERLATLTDTRGAACS